ncbi:hypothetical protein [Cellulosilyticum sp. I15G10I2]|uniref:hypothetical protein n=1 Tax=Cellulosilyticum sp. I15G10I2 TaxID=1892843 RepID=UPI002E8E1522|nr:hypothetical protein [Cellulosilyticum sp. I15G10I2]
MIGSIITITAQLFESTIPNNIFAPIAETAVILAPALTGVVVLGAIRNGILLD